MQSPRKRSSSPQYNFKIALADFQTLKKQPTIPHKMKVKLQYLQNKLMNRKINMQEYKQLPEYQLDSLEQCDKPSQMNLFVSIVKCLAGKEIIVYFKNQKAFIKKDQTFSIWHKCYLSCDSNNVYIKKKTQNKTNYFQFQIEKMKLSKKYLQLKKRMCFGLLYEQKKFIIGFDQQSACQRIFKTIKSLIQQHRPLSSTRIRQIQQIQKIQTPQKTLKQNGHTNGTLKPKSKSNPKQKSQQQKPNEQALLQFTDPKPTNKNEHKQSSASVMQYQKDQSYEQNLNQLNKIKQKELQQMIKNQLSKQNFFSDKEYKLIKNTDLGRILVFNYTGLNEGQSQNNSTSDKEIKTKMSTILNLQTTEIDHSWFFIQYMDMKNWNLQIEECRIINRISKNSYKYFIQFKKYSLMSLMRWAIVIVTAIVIDKKGYLIIKSCDQLTEQQQNLGNDNNYMYISSAVKMKKYYQILQICKKSLNDKIILATLVTIADFGGYCSKTDNLNMTLQVIDNMQNFHNFLQTQLINKQYENNYNQIFQLNSGNQIKLLKTNGHNHPNVILDEDQNMGMINKCDISSILRTPKNNNNNGNNDSQMKKRKMSINSNSQLSIDQNELESMKGSKLEARSNQKVTVDRFMEREKQMEFEVQKSGNNMNKKEFDFQISSKGNSNSGEIAIQNLKSRQILYKEFLKQFEPFQVDTKGSQRLVQLIHQKKVQQSYYLKHRFPNQSNYNPDAKKYPNDPVSNNWFLQKGIWKIDGIELIFTDQQVLTKQKNVIKFILKQLSSNVMSGKSIMNMSLPVEIFQKKSFLQKLGQCYGLFPYYFQRAAKQKNIVKQIVTVAQAFCFATTICPTIQKPFNPILGQTYQCSIGGINLCFQQISHHPPISAFYFRSQQGQFQCYGNHHPSVDMGLNSAIAKNVNPMHVRFFNTNTKYIVYTQDYQIGGLMFGQRTYKNSGRFFALQQNNDILLQLSYNGKHKKGIYEPQAHNKKKFKTGQIIGGVYKVSNSFSKRLLNNKDLKIKTFQGMKYDQKIQELAKISGTWMGDFIVNGQKVRGLYDVIPFAPQKQLYVLPSDCAYRLDVYYTKMGDIRKAQQWKQVMQNAQRKDKKLREEYNKAHGISNKH